jgi:hypothetical protein
MEGDGGREGERGYRKWIKTSFFVFTLERLDSLLPQ